jgi:hypothetical protein
MRIVVNRFEIWLTARPLVRRLTIRGSQSPPVLGVRGLMAECDSGPFSGGRRAGDLFHSNVIQDQAFR